MIFGGGRFIMGTFWGDFLTRLWSDIHQSGREAAILSSTSL